MKNLGRMYRVASLCLFFLLGVASAGSAAEVGPTMRSGSCEVPLLALEPTDAPVGITPCPGVRPGGRAVIGGVEGCTLNFLFKGSDGVRYIGTAGHCVLGESGSGPVQISDEGEFSWRRGKGPVVTDEVGGRIGEVAYAIRLDDYDFALVRIDRSVRSSPKMCHWGGPTGVNVDDGAGPVVLRLYGHGTASGRSPVVIQGDEPYMLPARSAVTTDMSDPMEVYAWGYASFGDSGGPVIDDEGRAVGLTTRLSTAAPLTGGNVAITRLSLPLRRAEKRMDISLELMTAGR